MRSIPTIVYKYTTDSDEEEETITLKPLTTEIRAYPREPIVPSTLVQMERRTGCDTLLYISVAGAGCMYLVLFIIHACVSHVSA